MRIGIMIGEVRGPATITDLRDQIAAADGMASVWSAQGLGWDALTALALAGASGPATRLGTAAVPVRQRHPLTLASQVLSLQAVTGNRLTLGVGAGIGAMVTGMFGLPADRPVRYMREYLSVLRPLLSGAPVDHSSAMLTAAGAVTVAGTEPPPVLLAALGPGMLRLAGEAADGAITWMAGPRTLSDHVVPLIAAAAQAAGRAAPRIVAGLPVCVTSDIEGARRRIGQQFAMAAHVPEYRAVLDREGANGPGDVAVVGDEDAVARRLTTLAASGASEFVAAPVGTADEQARTTALLRHLG